MFPALPECCQAMKTVAESGGQYHILILIADGQVCRAVGKGSTYLAGMD